MGGPERVRVPSLAFVLRRWPQYVFTLTQDQLPWGEWAVSRYLEHLVPDTGCGGLTARRVGVVVPAHPFGRCKTQLLLLACAVNKPWWHKPGAHPGNCHIIWCACKRFNTTVFDTVNPGSNPGTRIGRGTCSCRLFREPLSCLIRGTSSFTRADRLTARERFRCWSRGRVYGRRVD